MRLGPCLSLCVIVGCASAPPRYGNFLVGHAEAQAAMALDAAELLLGLLVEQPRLTLDAPPRDAFGLGLVQQLRDNGLEPSTVAHKGAPRLRYAVDQLKRTSLLRVTLVLGTRRLSRAYALKGSTAVAQGPWSISRGAGG
jgi:hypothetical protein